MAEDTTKKTVEILHPQIADTTENWKQRVVPIPENHFAVDVTKRIIKIGDGIKPFTNLMNHTHDEQYSSLAHHHYFGYGEKWMRTKPALWLRSDLPNHPELVELNGQYLDDERAAKLIDLYVSEGRISPVATSMSSEHYEVTASSTSPLCLPYRAFGDSITMNNFLNALDQWVTEHTGEDTEEWLSLEIKGSALYSLTAYVMVARCGTPMEPFIPSPSPKSWQVEVSEDGSVWESIDTVIDAPVWSTNEQRSYVLTGPVKDTRFMRIRITQWHIPENSNCVQEVGLRRIAFYGRRAGGFVLPNLPSLHPDFAWVIPIDDIGIGMKHEEIGDTGITYNTMPLLPKNRIIADGRQLLIAENEQLYGCFYQAYAKPIAPKEMSSNIGVTDITNAEQLIIDVFNTEESHTVPFKCDMSFDDIVHLGKISISFGNANCVAKNLEWVYFTDTGDRVTLMSVIDNTKNYLEVIIPGHLEIAQLSLIVHKWSSDIAPITKILISLHGSEKGYFYLPDLTQSDSNGTPYIVTAVRTEDINSKVVLDLQQVVSDLQKQLASTIKRLSDAELEIATLKNG